MRRMKRKTIWAYLDGKKLVDVAQAALDNNMFVDDLNEKGEQNHEKIQGRLWKRRKRHHI